MQSVEVPLILHVSGVLLDQPTNRTCFFSVLFRLQSYRRSSGPRPFQRLQIDDDDDDPLLE